MFLYVCVKSVCENTKLKQCVMQVRHEWRGAAVLFALLGLLVPAYVLYSIIMVCIILWIHISEQIEVLHTLFL